MTAVERGDDDAAAAPWTIRHLDEMERTGAWRLARRALDLRAFGMNVVEIAPGGAIPEHDELERDQEEVFIVLEGRPQMVIDGERHPAPKGTFVRLDPAPRRTVVNDEDAPPALVLIVSAPRTSGYRPMDWA